MTTPIFAVGDPHGQWDDLHRACRRAPQPGIILLLGDYDLKRPMAEILADEIATGWRVHWIIGNHDTDNDRSYDNLMLSTPEADIGGRWANVGGLIVGGLGGTYRDRVWYPKAADSEAPKYLTRRDYMRQVRPADRWRMGMPRPMRSAIFPEDHERLARLRLDVLVSHEAPTTVAMRDKGFHGLTELLDATRARLCIHGHHHHSYTERLVLPSGRECVARGLDIGEVWQVELPS